MPTKTAYNVEKSDKSWLKLLGADVYRILRGRKTEPAGSSDFDEFFPEDGIFRCAGCSHPLYTADSKFKSDCGWPCFDSVIYSSEYGCHVGVKIGGMSVEILCNNCGGHLGHVFYGEKCTENDERH
eukprot:TRINITY_DN42239_c0_g1_i1.p1 TRINITY_DN42239_c0_g1~~TRINITY_DN42239_c0_g1_i1.p1  ORF type:complete len:126 (+),score=23.35 TRINITY_DN42239_c0_g1_i1:20-397(+)